MEASSGSTAALSGRASGITSVEAKALVAAIDLPAGDEHGARRSQLDWPLKYTEIGGQGSR